MAGRNKLEIFKISNSQIRDYRIIRVHVQLLVGSEKKAYILGHRAASKLINKENQA